MSEMLWWCVARGESWTWDWQPYPGVWIFVATFGALYWYFARPAAAAPSDRAAHIGSRVTQHVPNDSVSLDSNRRAAHADASHRFKPLFAITGLLLLWITLDWPAGALGAGYLASVHSLQYVSLAMIVPPLLLSGISDASFRRLAARPRAVAVLRRVTALPVAAFAFTAVMILTHTPQVLDPLMTSQAGNFMLDMSWLLSGFLLAWPVIVPVPERPRFSPPLRILYLFLGTVAHVFLGMWFLSSRFPQFSTYELAPRVMDITALADQQLAGAAILLVGTPVVLGWITLIFFRWQGVGEERVPIHESHVANDDFSPYIQRQIHDGTDNPNTRRSTNG
jgi:cytochrome c oxidase assembly factor CtaG